MRKFTLLIFSFALLIASCDFMNKSVEGNGNYTTQTRSISRADRIRLEGSFDVVLVPSSTTSVRVEADENLMQYIITKDEDGWLVIRPEDHTNLKSSQKIRVTVSTDKVEALDVSGSGTVTSQSQFTGGDKLDVDLSGSGEIKMNVNTPKVEGSISGSGHIVIVGETKNLKVSMSGSGTFNSTELLCEDANIDIAGSGNASVYADSQLKVSIAGSGDVYYKGKAEVHSDIAGSGGVKRL